MPTATGERLLALRSLHALAGTADALNAEGLTTATGEAWTVSTVAKAHKRLTQNLTQNLTKENCAASAA